VSEAAPGETASSPLPRGADRALACALFFVSGALGLGYQLVWVRKAALVVGASQIALATVLTSFFLGMALGSAAIGRWLRSPSRSPLAIYGIFEIGIGVFALAFPLAFAALEHAYGALYDLASASALALFALRFALLFVLFLPPTFLMGATLPLLLDGLVARDREVGAFTSLLYGINILGAVAGVLATSYFAIPVLGMNGSSRVAALANLAVGALALAAFGRRAPLHRDGEAARPATSRFYLAASFVSGLAAIGYQIAWARWFALIATGNVHVTALLLATYLAALAAGSLLLSALLRRGLWPLRALAAAQLAAPPLVFACLWGWQLAALRHEIVPPVGTLEISSTWQFASETIDDIFVSPLLEIAAVLFAPVVLLGMGLPALVAAATAHAQGLRAVSARLLFWNTLGSSAGGFAVGYALIPAFGLAGTLRALAALSLGLGLAAVLRFRRETGRAGLPRAALAFALASAAATAWLGRGDPVRQLTAAVASREGRVVEIEEGPVTTASVFASGDQLTLATGSVRHATATRGEISPQVVQGHLPALFYPREGAPKRVLGIALGSGQAFGALLQHPVEQMDVVDISPEIVDLAFRHFAPFNYEIGLDPRVKMHLDDGRHFVDRAPDASYDAVLLEPSPPSHDGMHALYSLEFTESVRRVLRDDGVFMQWLPLQFVTPEEARRIIATFASVFPHNMAFRTSATDVMLLGWKTEAMPRFPLERLEERLEVLRQEPHMRGRRRRWSPDAQHEAFSLLGMLSLVLSGPEALDSVEAPPLRDDVPLLSYGAADRYLTRRYEGPTLAKLTFNALPLSPYAKLQRYFGGPLPLPDLEDERAHVLSNFRFASPIEIAMAEERFYRALPGGPRARRALALAGLHEQSGGKTASLAWIRVMLNEAPLLDSEPVDQSVRNLARHRIELESEQLRAWLEGLGPELRDTPVALAMADELAQHDARMQARRAGYWFE
jgi:predicted membrane-bound spermidine synthase